MKVSLIGFGLVIALTGGTWIAPAVTASAEKSYAASKTKDTTPRRSVGRVMSDVTITGNVKTALMQDKQVSAREINVGTVKGIVHLKGNVDSKAEARKAVALAKRVDGVKGVKSHLKIVPDEKMGTKGADKRRSVGRVMSDVTITSKVKSALVENEQVSAREINVDTVKGVVHLKGNVDSKAEAQKAVALAKKVEGVKGVKSHLKIVPNE
jgi:hyperosmotically inducible protein